MRKMLVSAVLFAAFAGAAHAEERSLSGFTRVAASAGTHVEVAVGPNFRVEVTGADPARVITRVSGDTLVVSPQRGNWRGRIRNTRVRVTMPAIEGLDVSSGAQISASGLNSPRVTLEASSGARLTASGVCGAFRADVSSGADIFAQTLRCEAGSAGASSGARVRIHASERLDVRASSGGSIIGHGDPRLGDVSLSSGGSFRRAS